MPLVYLSLGTNLGDRSANLENARNALQQAMTILRASSIYETEPWGFQDQPAFLNQVLKVSTSFEPLKLLDFLKNVEAKMGRQANFRYGPRLIDLDILLYGRQIIETQGLQIPHPRLHERAFVLEPLAEIVPNLVHPLLHKRISTLLAQAEDRDGVKKWA